MRSRECVTTPPEPIKNQYTELTTSNIGYKPLEIKPTRKQDSERKTFVEYRKDLNGEIPRSPTEEDNHGLPFSPITLEFQCKAT